MHQRKLIRDKIVELLTGATSVGEKVYSSQARPLTEAGLPCILVYANSEPVEIFQESPRQYKRNLSISIEIVAKANETLENDLDAIAASVESKLMQDYTLGDLAADLILTGTELTITPNGDTLIGSCVLTYLVPWYSYAVSDQTEENNFTNFGGADVEWQRPETKEVASGQLDAEDTLDLPSGTS